jgi:AraC-like DNA-binding protein
MPSRIEPGISATIVAPVARALAELGLHAGGPQPDAQTVIPGGTADALLDAAAVALKDDALGLNIARRLPLGSFGTLDYAMVTSATLREGLRRMTRYYAIATQRVTVKLEEAGGTATLAFTRKPGLKHSRHWLELSFGVITERMRQTVGRKLDLGEVLFTHPPPLDTRVHDDYFGIKVQFAAATDRLSFNARLLDLPLRTAAESLAEILDAKMRALAPLQDGADAYLDRVRRVVTELLSEREASLAAALSRLKITRRTLQRELARRGTSHSALLDDARRLRGLELLDSGDMTVAEVSDALGFSEPSSFFRAFRRWTGQSPKALIKSKRK